MNKVYSDMIEARVAFLKNQIDYLKNKSCDMFERGRLQALEEELVNQHTEESVKELENKAP